MVPSDLRYLKLLLDRGLIKSPCLELGAAMEEHSARNLITEHGIEYYSTDIAGNVDFRIDFEQEPAAIRAAIGPDRMFGSALVFNVLEHTFDPIRILDHVFALLRPGGSCAILTPTVWPNHSYPIDCWRVLPDFYVEYAKRRGHAMVDQTFRYVSHGPVKDFQDDATIALPVPGRSKTHWVYSRIVHKLFRTAGRGMLFPSHVATAVVLEKRAI